MENPCKDCPKRTLYCHDACPERAAWLEDQKDRKAYLKAARGPNLHWPEKQSAVYKRVQNRLHRRRQSKK